MLSARRFVVGIIAVLALSVVVVMPQANASTTTLTTTLSTTTVSRGSPFSDSASLTGGTTSPPVSGTISFIYFAGTTCSPTGLQYDAGSVTVSGNGVYTSASITISTPGSYELYAVYHGDSHNAVATSSCEPFTVTTTTITSSSCPPASSGGIIGVCVVIGQPDLTTVTSGKAPTPTDIGNPSAVAFDSKGNLWVVDESNNRVLEYAPPFSTGEAASLVIGQTGLRTTGDSSPAGSLLDPTDIAFDPSGNLWVVDSGDNRMLGFVPPFSDGELASLVLGQPTFGGYIGQTTSGGLNGPTDIAFDLEGNLYVTDQGNNRVLEFAAPFSTGEKASFVYGQDNFTASGPGAGAKGLFEPLGIAFWHGSPWIADSANHRVLTYNGFVTYFPANLILDGGSSAGINAQGIAFDSAGNLWVSDGIDSISEFVVPLSASEAAIQVIGPKVTGGSATTSTGSVKLSDPQGIAFDSTGNLWVADHDHGRVIEYELATSSLSSSTSSSTASSTTSGSSGGVPAFPYQVVTATIFTVILAVDERCLLSGGKRSSELKHPVVSLVGHIQVPL